MSAKQAMPESVDLAALVADGCELVIYRTAAMRETEPGKIAMAMVTAVRIERPRRGANGNRLKPEHIVTLSIDGQLGDAFRDLHDIAISGAIEVMP